MSMHAVDQIPDSSIKTSFCDEVKTPITAFQFHEQSCYRRDSEQIWD
jgi:hypothetical protein